jgi:hypothetical protein
LKKLLSISKEHQPVSLSKSLEIIPQIWIEIGFDKLSFPVFNQVFKLTDVPVIITLTAGNTL